MAPARRKFSHREYVAFAAAALVHALLVIGWSTHLSSSMPSAVRPLQVSVFASTRPSPALEQAPAPGHLPAPRPVKPATAHSAAVSEPPPSSSPAPYQQPHASTVDDAASPVTAMDAPITAPAIRKLPARVDTAYLDNPEPVFPALSRRLGEQGRVLLQVRVGPDGSVLEVSVAHSSGYPRLDGAATRAVVHWRFLPASINGVAIESTVTVPIHFSLDS